MKGKLKPIFPNNLFHSLTSFPLEVVAISDTGSGEKEALEFQWRAEIIEQGFKVGGNRIHTGDMSLKNAWNMFTNYH